MTCSIHYPKEPRQNVIFAAVSRYIRETSVSFETYAQAVVEHYNAHVYPREIKFSNHEDVYTRKKTDCRHIKRWMDLDATARLPVEMEESLVFSLPEKYRLPLLSELAARYGLLATPIPGKDSSCPVSLANMCTEFAGVVESMGPLIADGTLENDSLRDLLNAQREARELMAVLAGWTAQIDSTIQHKQGRVV